MDRNYYDTFIRVAPDCPVRAAVVPTGRGDHKTIPQMEYELLAGALYTYSQEEVLFTAHVRRQEITPGNLKARRDALWDEFFGKSRACLRASMLPKKYGWGLHFDAEGRVALVAVESAQYKAFVAGKGVKAVVMAMRNKRA